MKKSKRRKDTSLFQDIQQLLSYVSRRRQRQLWLLLGLMIVASCSEIVSLGAIVPFLGALSNPEAILENSRWKSLLALLQIETSIQLVTWLAFAFILSAIAANGLRFLTINVQTRLSAIIGSELSCQMYQKALQQPYRFHIERNSSDLMQTVTGDTLLLTSAVLTPLLTLVANGFMVTALVGTLLVIDTRIALSAAVSLGGVYIFSYRVRRKLLDKNSKIVAQASERRIRAVQESLGGIRDVLIANTQDFFQRTYQEAEFDLKNASARSSIIAQTPKYVVETVAISAIVLLALSLGRDGDFSQAIPILGSFTLGAKRLLPTLQEMFLGFARIQATRASLQRSLIALQQPINPLLLRSTSTAPLFLEKELRLENIWFRYSDETNWVLQDLSLSIAAKTTVGFVGSTGSGKSTTADLILGLLQPQRGTILADGLPLEGEQLRRWQQGIAHVPQSIFLTDSTIAENIAFGIPRKQIDFEQVIEAAQLAQIDDYIHQLPAGYESYVGERGIRLSGGQRQRIGIARALYQKATVIVFDEATSALDNVTEKEVMAAINGLNHQFTVILIAHRLSTVQRCDLIFELDKGQIVSKGKYQELLDSSPSFNLMVQGAK